MEDSSIVDFTSLPAYAWVTSVVLGVLGLVSIVKRHEATETVIVLVKWVLQGRRNGPRFSGEQIQAMRTLSRVLNRKFKESHGIRVNAIALHNGGGDILAPGDRFLTVIDSQAGDVLVDSAESWFRVPLSHEFLDDVIKPMLATAPGIVPFIIRTDELNPKNYLVPHYQVDNIGASVVCLASAASKKVIWFVSINYIDLPLDSDLEVPEARMARAIAMSSAMTLAQRVAELAPYLPDPHLLPSRS